MGGRRRAGRFGAVADPSRWLRRTDAADADPTGGPRPAGSQLRPAWARTPQRRTDPLELGREVLGAFRPRMWALAGRTVLESLRVLDWADQQLGNAGRRFVGGVSMGGDIAVALAGTDERITRVTALVATPDWTRPGMRMLDDQKVVLDQGEADRYAEWFYDAFDPMTHLDAYRRDLAISFVCGGTRSARARRGRPSFSRHAGRARAGGAVRRPRPPRRRPRRAGVHRSARVADALNSGAGGEVHLRFYWFQPMRQEVVVVASTTIRGPRRARLSSSRNGPEPVLWNR